MKNVTVTLPEEVARWARVRAAEEGVSLSRFLGQLLRDRMADDHAYEAARRSSLALRPVALKGQGHAYPSREELHDRPMLRR